MSWQLRHGKYYWYDQKTTQKGKVSVYRGRGPLAHQLAAVFAKKRLLKDQQKRRFEEEKNEQERFLAENKALDKMVLEVVNLTLLNHNYHFHRGGWRKRRNYSNA